MTRDPRQDHGSPAKGTPDHPDTTPSAVGGRRSAVGRRATRHLALLVALLLTVAAIPAAAQAQNLVEVGASADAFTGGFADGRGLYARTEIVRPVGVWRAEWGVRERFGEAGTVFGVGHQRELGHGAFASVSVGSSAGSRFESRVRAGAEVGARWGPSRRLVTTAGVWYYAAADEHRDVAVTAEAALYPAPGVVLQAGGRFTRSAPGPVWTPYGYAAVTLGRPGRASFALRAATGREGYLLAAPTPLEVDFSSYEVSATWRQPIGPRYGVQVRASHYGNPAYQRTGAELGVFARF
ncbi:MAG TPA: YaiO family outer membrane beta-barrel protein [Rhodothermales bacterium]|nr:YaiO family outer membrane beta-barrel protein [Rhodothermales bacterium]